ncbi:MAG TPA: putative glycolipid-binding domain-containing protein [Gemmatimonadaceae bacterium]|nr:putative glycolipid-binding domain-containing protein [Gemmatimonadaceae bacterium]
MTADRDDRLVRALLWRREDEPGMEHFRLHVGDGGARLTGTVLLAHDGAPLHAEYEVECSVAWETRAVRVTQRYGGAERALVRTVSDGRWWRDGADVPTLHGCVDVDIAVTPSTNTLPIRRLRMAVGETREITAAWVRLPELVVQPLVQRYTRVDARRWRYESPAHGFATELEVDELGIVVRYPPVWERVAVAGG